jgi:four helix bundle protein
VNVLERFEHCHAVFGLSSAVSACLIWARPVSDLQRVAAEKQLKFKQRTKEFARDSVHACRTMKGGYDSRYIATQLIRSSTSVAANYRSACRARSKREFIAKIGIVLEEADEANELVAILTATLKTATRNSATSANSSTQSEI